MLFNWLNAKLPEDMSKILNSKFYREGKFHNEQQHQRKGNSGLLRYLKRLLLEKSSNRRPHQAIPIKKINKAELFLLDDNNIHLFKLGHSSVLMKLAADFWLIDPVLSMRASPFYFWGPKRFHANPIEIEDLPPLKGIIISHNHYDHLDKQTISALAQRTELFMVPLGVEGDLMRWGVRQSQIRTFDWWQEYRLNNLVLTFTPAHHYSGRGFNDNSTTLWGSWIVEFNRQKVFYSGDSGYFAGFKEIGERHGPFDICLIETGAYDEQWPHVHMQPEQSVQSFIDLRGKTLIPIHNATFNLAFHPWNEPLIRLSEIATERELSFITPMFGELITVGSKTEQNVWWLDNH